MSSDCIIVIIIIMTLAFVFFLGYIAGLATLRHMDYFEDDHD